MPYRDLDPDAFWRRCRDSGDFLLSRLHKPKFPVPQGARIGTIGSCFAQNIARHLRGSVFEFVDAEPPPEGISDQVANQFGYGLFSARYGNVYTARQFRQMLEDAVADRVHDAAIWETDGRFYDGLRPSVEPGGHATAQLVRDHRLAHLRKVLELFQSLDVVIFTLGLTEAWADRSGLVFPVVPGAVAGTYNPAQHQFLNLRYPKIQEDLTAILALLHEFNPEMRLMLTVSPVPLVATATGDHVLRATTYSKATLRAAAQDFASDNALVDYFPSYEIITGAPFRSRFYAENLRSVTPEGIETVMRCFFGAYGGGAAPEVRIAPKVEDLDPDGDAFCDEVLLESFLK